MNIEDYNSLMEIKKKFKQGIGELKRLGAEETDSGIVKAREATKMLEKLLDNYRPRDLVQQKCDLIADMLDKEEVSELLKEAIHLRMAYFEHRATQRSVQVPEMLHRHRQQLSMASYPHGLHHGGLNQNVAELLTKFIREVKLQLQVVCTKIGVELGNKKVGEELFELFLLEPELATVNESRIPPY